MQAKELATQAVARLGEFNRRTLDGLGSRIYFYYSWAHEQTNTLADIRGWATISLLQADLSISVLSRC